MACGEERQALDVCTHFARKGWSVTAYTKDVPAIDREFRAASIDVRHAPLLGPFDPGTFTLLARDLRMERPGTIVHVHRFRDAFAVLLARKLARRKDIKVVMSCHKVRRARDSRIARRIYRNLDAVLFDSTLARERFLSTWPDGKIPFPTERIRVVRGGINIDVQKPCDEPASGPKIAMFHGRLTPEKGLETLIDALLHIKGKRTRLWIVGSGDPDYVDALRRRAIARGVMDMIDWKGFTPDVHPLIRQSHFGVLPYVAPASFGLANVEYMANGRPQITTCHGAPAEYIDNDVEGMLIAPANPPALGEAMLRMISEPQTRAEMGRAAYGKYLSKLAWNKVAPEMESLYDEILNGKKGD